MGNKESQPTQQEQNESDTSGVNNSVESNSTSNNAVVNDNKDQNSTDEKQTNDEMNTNNEETESPRTSLKKEIAIWVETLNKYSATGEEKHVRMMLLDIIENKKEELAALKAKMKENKNVNEPYVYTQTTDNSREIDVNFNINKSYAKKIEHKDNNIAEGKEGNETINEGDNNKEDVGDEDVNALAWMAQEVGAVGAPIRSRQVFGIDYEISILEQQTKPTNPTIEKLINTRQKIDSEDDISLLSDIDFELSDDDEDAIEIPAVESVLLEEEPPSNNVSALIFSDTKDEQCDTSSSNTSVDIAKKSSIESTSSTVEDKEQIDTVIEVFNDLSRVNVPSVNLDASPEDSKNREAVGVAGKETADFNSTTKPTECVETELDDKGSQRKVTPQIEKNVQSNNAAAELDTNANNKQFDTDIESSNEAKETHIELNNKSEFDNDSAYISPNTKTKESEENTAKAESTECNEISNEVKDTKSSEETNEASIEDNHKSNEGKNDLKMAHPNTSEVQAEIGVSAFYSNKEISTEESANIAANLDNNTVDAKVLANSPIEPESALAVVANASNNATDNQGQQHKIDNPNETVEEANNEKVQAYPEVETSIMPPSESSSVAPTSVLGRVALKRTARLNTMKRPVGASKRRLPTRRKKCAIAIDAPTIKKESSTDTSSRSISASAPVTSSSKPKLSALPGGSAQQMAMLMQSALQGGHLKQLKKAKPT